MNKKFFVVVQPLPGNLVTQQIIGDGLLLIVLGIVVAYLNKPATTYTTTESRPMCRSTHASEYGTLRQCRGR